MGKSAALLMAETEYPRWGYEKRDEHRAEVAAYLGCDKNQLAAHAKGVITVVDGAHLNGQVAARIDDPGCDFYAGSPHKWMFAPADCGILWGRPEMLERLSMALDRYGRLGQQARPRRPLHESRHQQPHHF
jgi:kynureninase